MTIGMVRNGQPVGKKIPNRLWYDCLEFLARSKNH